MMHASTRKGQGVGVGVGVGVGSLGAARLGAAALALGWMAAAADAGVFQYSLSRGANYTQTSSSPPDTATAWNLLATVVSDEPMISAGLQFDRPPVVFSDLLEGTPTSWYFNSAYYETEEEFLEAYPATTYTLSADVGAGTTFGDLFLPAHDYMAEIPYFSGGTFDGLRSYDTSAAFLGTVGGFTLPAGAEFGVTIVTLVDSTPATVWSAELEPGETGFEIPAGLLAPDSVYSIGVTYYSWAVLEDVGFGDADAVVQFARGTGMFFRTLESTCGGCPADLNCDGIVDFTDYLEFLNLFDASDLRVDFNHDGIVDFSDYLEFLNLYDAGC